MSNKVLTYSGLSYYHGKITQELNKKQNTLVSGTNIKTINGQSLLGSGNLTIGGGGTTLYKHEIQVRDTQHNVMFNFVVYCSRSTSFTSIFQLGEYANDNTYIAWCNGSQNGLAVFNISDDIYIYYTTFSGNYSIDENYIYDVVVSL